MIYMEGKKATNSSKKTTVKKKTASTTTKTKSSVKPTKTKTVTKVKEPQVVAKEKKEPEIIKQNNNLILKPKFSTIIITILALLLIILVIIKNMDLTRKDLTKSYLVNNSIIKNELTNENLNTFLNKEQSFVLITSFNNEEEYNLEKQLKKEIEKNKLQDDFFVFDANKYNTVDLNKYFLLDNREIKIPTILYYKNGSLINIVEREDEKMIEVGDFAKLLDIYEIAK